MVFIGPVLRDASFYRTTGNTVYLYSLDWLSSNALIDVTERRLRGVSHGTELSYLFETSCQFYNCTSGDNLLRQYFSTTWVNFIKLGSVNLYSFSTLNILNIPEIRHLLEVPFHSDGFQ